VKRLATPSKNAFQKVSGIGFPTCRVADFQSASR
jgi:hypothetical protein